MRGKSVFLFASLLLLFLFSGATRTLAEETEYEYSISDNKVTITKASSSDASVVIPYAIEGKPVVYIGIDAFAGNENLVHVTIPEGVERIRMGAFQNCENLQTVVFPKSLRSIGPEAFRGCTKLNPVTLNEGLLDIGDFAFADNDTYKRIEIPASLKEIGRGAFLGSAVEMFSVKRGSRSFRTYSGMLTSADGEILYQYPLGNDRKSVTIPSAVKQILSYSIPAGQYTTVKLNNNLVDIYSNNFLEYNHMGTLPTLICARNSNGYAYANAHGLNYQFKTTGTGSGSGSGGGGSRNILPVQNPPAPGVWKLDHVGWWFQRNNNTWPKSEWVMINNAWYWFDASGYMATGWRQINGSWYYLKSDGSMQTGWLKDRENWYYLTASGYMIVNQVTPDGYYVNQNGVWIP